jgi:hypothetical protein
MKLVLKEECTVNRGESIIGSRPEDKKQNRFF